MATRHSLDQNMYHKRAEFNEHTDTPLYRFVKMILICILYIDWHLTGHQAINSATRLTKDAADNDSTICCLASIVNSLLSSSWDQWSMVLLLGWCDHEAFFLHISPPQQLLSRHHSLKPKITTLQLQHQYKIYIKADNSFIIPALRQNTILINVHRVS